MIESSGGVLFTSTALWLAVAMALSLAAVVAAERAALGYQVLRRRRLEARYAPIVRRALEGDSAAHAALAGSPSRHRLDIAALLMAPLIETRDPGLVARIREEVRGLALRPYAERLLRSWWWWRRAFAVRALGLLQHRQHTARVVAALDDPNPDVRGAALDALADLRDPASLKAIVVRLHDTSLHRGRRMAALGAFGSDGEPMVLDLAGIDPANRFAYARALTICGTAASRPALCRWTADARPEVRAAAFEALAHVGLDAESARLAIAALESPDVAVRAMAATALHGWQGPDDAAGCLARHLDDAWTVAVPAARSLQSIVPAGVAALQARASQPDLPGVLARQMLWEASVR